MSEFRTPSMESTFVSEIPSVCEMEECIVAAAGKGKKPVSILNDKFGEVLGHPHCFLLVNMATKLKGKFH